MHLSPEMSCRGGGCVSIQVITGLAGGDLAGTNSRACRPVLIIMSCGALQPVICSPERGRVDCNLRRHRAGAASQGLPGLAMLVRLPRNEHFASLSRCGVRTVSARPGCHGLQKQAQMPSKGQGDHLGAGNVEMGSWVACHARYERGRRTEDRERRTALLDS